MFLERIAGFVERHCMFREGQTVGVAVSGGADSVCLLYVLRELAPRWNLRLRVLHLNHHLRGRESDGDAEFVRALGERLGVEVAIGDADVGASSGNLEQAARWARLEFFREQVGSGVVATGHTKSDQAETVLFRMLRGAGSAGLAGIRPVTEQGIVRPLLEVDRAETEGYLRERGVEWREDSSNADGRFARNRIRHELMPRLAREWNPQIVETLAQTAEWARAEEAWWSQETDRLAKGLLVARDGAVFVKAGGLAALPLAAARRVVRRAMERAKGDLRGIDFGHVEAVLRLGAADRGHGRVQLPGVGVVRSFDWLRFGGGWAAEGFSEAALVPGVYRAPGTHLELCLDLIEKTETFEGVNSVYNDRMGGLDWDRLSGQLAWRNWRAGDRYRPSGSTGEEKIKTLFQRARIPLWERRNWPVLMDGPSIVWARQFGPAAEFVANSGTRWVLMIRERGSLDEIGIGNGRDDV